MPRSVDDPITSNRANITATLNVLAGARKAGVKRLVYAGSSSAYGDTAVLPKQGQQAIITGQVHRTIRLRRFGRQPLDLCGGQHDGPAAPADRPAHETPK